MKHLQHFGLSDDPILNEPVMRLHYAAAPHQATLRRVERSVRQGKALTVLTGDVGAGKSMILRQLLEGLEEEVFEATMMVVLYGAADAASILRRFAKQLGIEEPPAAREALLGQLYEQLAIVREDGRQAVLMIDDAQALASEGALVEVCELLKLEYEGRRLLSVVLSGSPALWSALPASKVSSWIPNSSISAVLETLILTLARPSRMRIASRGHRALLSLSGRH